MNNTLFATAVVVSWFLDAGDSARAAQAAGSANAGPAVVARVNGEPVTRAEFQRMLGNPLTRSELRQERLVEVRDPRELERLALRKTIHHRLLVQEAVRRNIVIPPGELDKAIAALRRRFEDLESFGKWMKEQGLDDKALFDSIRADMMAARAWAQLADGVRITDAQATEYYASHKEDLAAGEEVRLRIIAVRDERAADDILASLKKGIPFGRLARQRSEGLRAVKGGDTGWVDSRTLAESLREAVSLLKPGDVGGPLERGSGEFLLVGLEGRRPIPARSLAEARAEIERRLLPAARQTVVAAWLAQREKQAKIEVFLSN